MYNALVLVCASMWVQLFYKTFQNLFKRALKQTVKTDYQEEGLPQLWFWLFFAGLPGEFYTLACTGTWDWYRITEHYNLYLALFALPHAHTSKHTCMQLLTMQANHRHLGNS